MANWRTPRASPPPGVWGEFGPHHLLKVRARPKCTPEIGSNHTEPQRSFNRSAPQSLSLAQTCHLGTEQLSKGGEGVAIEYGRWQSGLYRIHTHQSLQKNLILKRLSHSFRAGEAQSLPSFAKELDLQSARAPSSNANVLKPLCGMIFHRLGRPTSVSVAQKRCVGGIFRMLLHHLNRMPSGRGPPHRQRSSGTSPSTWGEGTPDPDLLCNCTPLP